MANLRSLHVPLYIPHRLGVGPVERPRLYEIRGQYGVLMNELTGCIDFNTITT